MSDSDWRELASEEYRRARELLAQCQGLQGPDLQYHVEELTEAMLDLKQATIANDAARAAKSMDEVMLLVMELR